MGESQSSYEQRIIAAALKLAENADDPNASSEAVSEIVMCARGMLRRKKRESLEGLQLGYATPEARRIYDLGQEPKDDDDAEGGER